MTNVNSKNSHQIALQSGADKIPETFGWVPGIVGLNLLTTGLASLLHHPGEWSPLQSVLIIGGSLLFGGILIFHELWRRKKRFVFVQEGDSVFAYQSGNFSHEFLRVDVTFYQLQPWKTARALAFTLTIALVGPFLLIVFHGSIQVVFFQSALVLALLPSYFYTRVLCYHYFVPKKRTRYRKTVMLPKKIGERLFGSLPA